MIVPNKFVSFKQSVLSKLPKVMSSLDKSKISLHDLFKKCRKSFEDVSEFILALDVLFVLGKIEFDRQEEMIRPC